MLVGHSLGAALLTYPVCPSVLLPLMKQTEWLHTGTPTYPLLCYGCCLSCPGWETSFHRRHPALRTRPWFWAGAALLLLEACFLTSLMVYCDGNLEDLGSCRGEAHSSDPRNEEVIEFPTPLLMKWILTTISQFTSYFIIQFPTWSFCCSIYFYFTAILKTHDLIILHQLMIHQRVQKKQILKILFPLNKP